MNNVLKEIFESYKPLVDSINFKLTTEIIPKNLKLFNDKESIDKNLCTIKNHLNLTLSENEKYTFAAFENVNCLMLKYSDNTQTLSFKFKDTPTPELYLDNIFFPQTINKNDNELSVSLSISSDLYFFVGMSSHIDYFNIFFEVQDFMSSPKEIDKKIVICPDLIPYFEKYKQLFYFSKSEPEAVSELLLKNKEFTNQQKDLFKLLYDFELFNTDKLNINLTSDIINKLEVKHKNMKKTQK